MPSVFQQATQAIPRVVGGDETELRSLLNLDLDSQPAELADAAFGHVTSKLATERATAYYILGALSQRHEKWREPTAAALARRAPREQDAWVAWHLARALGGTCKSSSIPLLAWLARHPNKDVRMAAAAGLHLAMGEGDTNNLGLRALTGLLSDPDDDARDYATFVLSELAVDGPDVRRALWDRLEDDCFDVRVQALLGLARRGDERCLPLVVELLDSGLGDSRVFRAAAHLADPTLVPLLARYMDDDEAESALEACDPFRRGWAQAQSSILEVMLQEAVTTRWPGLHTYLGRDPGELETWIEVALDTGPRRWAIKELLDAAAGDPQVATLRVVDELEHLVADKT